MQSQIWCLPAGSLVEASAKKTMVCTHFCQGESCPSSPCLKPVNSIPSCMSLMWHLTFCFSGGDQKNRVWVSTCTGPLRGTPGTLEAHHLTQPQSPLIFTARSYRHFYFWHWNFILGVWCVGGISWPSIGTFADEITLLIFNCHWLCKISLACISVPPTSLNVVSFYILSYRNFVHLDFRQFSVLVVPQFSNNFDVAVRGC